MTATINMVTARRAIIACYNRGEPLFTLGKPGMGKTALYESVAKELGIGFIDFRLSMRDPVEVGGMRIPDTKTGKLKHYVPEDLPDDKEHGPRGLLLFDEINAVGPMLQATTYGIIQERRSGAYRMPEGWVPMAAGNNVADRAAAQRISTALANRFNVQHVEPDLKSWLTQYGSSNVDQRGTAFLRFKSELFHVMPRPDETAFPSARSWTKAFKFIDEEPGFRRALFAGYVGTTAADEFEAFWRIMEKAPTIEEILADPKAARLPENKDPGTYYAVAGMVARFMDRKNLGKLMVYAERMIPEYQVAIMQDATGREPGLKNTGLYGAWATKNQQYLT